MLPAATARRPIARSRCRDERSRRRFAIGPGHGDVAHAGEPRERDLHLRYDAHPAARAVARGAHLAGRPDLPPRGWARAMRARSCRPASAATPAAPSVSAVTWIPAPDPHPTRRRCAPPAREASLRAATRSQADDGDLAVSFRRITAHRNLRVLRATVAKRIPRIQNRTIPSFRATRVARSDDGVARAEKTRWLWAYSSP